ncbi:neutral/alkaline nonlysosomal ceramidase [Capsaspora owczarzaki ATCC 30864]|uniref:Neutral ceramidase n=1 Tax=Capsaspora owczarzaki (strain ATCC 30864) TaxID=595528 RepID=A0A0D2WLQ9_CAPO3|nr:neutral/alkaline nonlysosomal ceramidase [Capsaspora owczarzaki ATCC 30864]KJE90898.1 neutral/alkaline nonlysosomal ceramidase [Capsaspora owczarzaki ATCC 30864]|eukprot:XP_004348881.2 neutral/alkaline nonlysosomal ceramidase [Capsaspora owczarzaki ATCC 30864]
MMRLALLATLCSVIAAVAIVVAAAPASPVSPAAPSASASAFASASASAPDAATPQYLIGAGIYDITGPIVDVNFMGYAAPAQTGRGLHFRQYARTLIVQDPTTGKRVIYVSADACMATQIMRLQVSQKLAAVLPDYEEASLCISGIHTHSTPAGFFQYVLFQITSLGFVKETLDAYVDGIVASIVQAHGNLQPGNLFVNQGELVGANINRSPSAYLNNPAAERAKYQYDTDTNMVLLKAVDANNNDLAMFNWFAVHCTSMNNTNRLVSGDNKGHASYLFEKQMNGKATLPGKGKFVAAFAQTNSGDVSPNTAGAFCISGKDAGKPCDFYTSLCDGRSEPCVGFGPGKDMTDSTRIIAEKQLATAQALYANASTLVQGAIDYRHVYLDITNLTVNYNNRSGQTCPPAMGYAFAAGTTDGAGAFNFYQGENSSNPFWNVVSGFLSKPSSEQIACHAPKPILLNTGYLNKPYAWQASIVDLQILRVGQIFIVAIPSEFTTMAGRRLRDAVKQALIEEGAIDQNGVVLISGLSNTYSDYVTTFEEYQVQRYEGGSTAYGPLTHDGYLQEFTKIARAMARNQPLPPGPNPPDMDDSAQFSFLPPVIEDAVPLGKKFGDVVTEPAASYSVGASVQAVFWSGCPRNDLYTNESYLTVEQQQADGSFAVVLTDADWDTVLEWKRTFTESPESHATVVWNIAAGTAPGVYRIRHFGAHKNILELGKITRYSGTSRTFVVTA